MALTSTQASARIRNTTIRSTIPTAKITFRTPNQFIKPPKPLPTLTVLSTPQPKPITMLILQPVSSVSAHRPQRTSTITTTITPAVATPTFTSTTTILGIGLYVHTFPSIGIRSTVLSIGTAGAATHTGIVLTIAGDGTTMAGVVLTITTTIILTMVEAWADMLQVSDTVAITLPVHSVTAHNNRLTAETKQAFLADLPSTEPQQDRQLAFLEELAQQPVHRQAHQAHVQPYRRVQNKAATALARQYHHGQDKAAATHAQATAIATVNRTLRQATAVHHVQVRNMYVHNQAAVHRQAALTDRHTTLAAAVHRQAATTEAATLQEVPPTQVEAVVQAQVTVEEAAVQALVLAEAAEAEQATAVAAVVAAEAEEDK